MSTERKKLQEKILDLLMDLALLYPNREDKRIIYQTRQDLKGVEDEKTYAGEQKRKKAGKTETACCLYE